jgi:tetratricopeptide (TPR) repeat protein
MGQDNQAASGPEPSVAAGAAAASSCPEGGPAGGGSTGRRPWRSRPSWPAALTDLAPWVIVLAVAVVYANSFAGDYVLDDKHLAEHARRLWPPSEWLEPPQNRRPVVNVTMAVSAAISGRDERGHVRPWGYHLLNAVIHAAAAVALFAVARRALLSRRLRGWLGRSAAVPAALAIAVIWAVHPLQTQAVTYIIQRSEALMGLLYLLTIYCVIRAARGGGWRWGAAAVAACAAGMATKEVMVTAPLLVLLYDRTFLAGGFASALRRRWGLYLGLAATWGVLAALLVLVGAGEPEVSAGFGMRDLSVLEYARSQPGVVAHYLRLAIWPRPLVLDYAWPVADTAAEILWPGVVVLVLIPATLLALWRWPTWGLLGSWLLLILAPTSSVLPIRDLAFEHRMYLPLAAVVAAVVGGAAVAADRLHRRTGGPWLVAWGGLAGAAAVALGAATIDRNRDYHDPVVIWEDVIAKRPEHPRGWNNLGLILKERGGADDLARAETAVRRAVELKPDEADFAYNLGNVYYRADRPEQAERWFRRALELDPRQAQACHNLATVLLAADGRNAEARQLLERALAERPEWVHTRYTLAQALAAAGRTSAAAEQYRRVLRRAPGHHKAMARLARLLATSRAPAVRDGEEAVRLATRACALWRRADATGASHLETLAVALAETGQFKQAAARAGQAAGLAERIGRRKLAALYRRRQRMYASGEKLRE